MHVITHKPGPSAIVARDAKRMLYHSVDVIRLRSGESERFELTYEPHAQLHIVEILLEYNPITVEAEERPRS